MHSVKILLALAALWFSLSAPVQAAPKSGDADFPTAAPSARHTAKVAAIKAGHYDLVLIGDSITHTIGELPGKYDPLKAVWDKHYAPRHAINLGHNGYRTEQILWNLQNGELDFAQSPKLFMILIGTNNADSQHFAKAHKPEEILAGTRAIVELIRQRHPTSKILLLRPFPKGLQAQRQEATSPPVFSFSQADVDAIHRAGELTASLADGKQVFWLDVNYLFLRPDGGINVDLMWDLLHPNAAGAEAWAQAVEPTLATLMGVPPIVDPPTPRMMVPVSRTDGSYDWMGRHSAILAAKATSPQIVFIGDSITHHLGGVPAPSGPFVSHRGDAFWQTICTPERPGLNLGFGADWTQHALWRLDHGELDGLAPRHVVLMIGTNNVLNGGDPAQIVEGIRACLIRIRAKVPHARIVLMGILPCRNPATHPHRLLAAKVNQELAKLAKTAQCDYLDLTPQFLDAQGNIPATLMDDAIHPTPAGYKIWSEALAPLLKADGAAKRP
jgi:lysophospholipase L1-like esterase